MNTATIPEIKIATLNLNGETSYLINRRPRLPQSLFCIDKIKQALYKMTQDGLEKLLSKNIYDVIAIQELIYITSFIDKIVEICKKHNYTLSYPMELSAHTHCSVAFITRNSTVNLPSSPLTDAPKLKTNKYQILTCDIHSTQFKFFNTHITSHSTDDKEIQEYVSNSNECLVVLGDMNAYIKEQTQDTKKESDYAALIEWLNDKFCKSSVNTNYTYFSDKYWRKLDHIFYTSKCMNIFSSFVETKDDSVNYYVSKNGFTDHSMLILDISQKKSNSDKIRL